MLEKPKRRALGHYTDEIFKFNPERGISRNEVQSRQKRFETSVRREEEMPLYSSFSPNRVFNEPRLKAVRSSASAAVYRRSGARSAEPTYLSWDPEYQALPVNALLPLDRVLTSPDPHERQRLSPEPKIKDALPTTINITDTGPFSGNTATPSTTTSSTNNNQAGAPSLPALRPNHFPGPNDVSTPSTPALFMRNVPTPSSASTATRPMSQLHNTSSPMLGAASPSPVLGAPSNRRPSTDSRPTSKMVRFFDDWQALDSADESEQDTPGPRVFSATPSSHTAAPASMPSAPSTASAEPTHHTSKTPAHGSSKSNLRYHSAPTTTTTAATTTTTTTTTSAAHATPLSTSSASGQPLVLRSGKAAVGGLRNLSTAPVGDTDEHDSYTPALSPSEQRQRHSQQQHKLRPDFINRARGFSPPPPVRQQYASPSLALSLSLCSAFVNPPPSAVPLRPLDDGEYHLPPPLQQRHHRQPLPRLDPSTRAYCASLYLRPPSNIVRDSCSFEMPRN